MSITSSVKNQIHAPRLGNARINLVFHPIVGDFSPNRVYVPSKACAEIAAPACEAKSTFRASRTERAVGAAYRATLPERHDVIGFFGRFRLGFPFAGSGLRFRLLLLCILVGNRDRLGLSYFRLGLGFRH